jgi:REP element-mobilizing transposase RayT
LRYFITFSCYGARLHGDELGSVDRNHNVVGSRVLDANPQRVLAESQRMLQEPYVLDQASRAVVLASLQQHCSHRGWNLLAAHVRSTHVHVIVEAEIRPERIMNEFKSYASRDLNRLRNDGPNRRRWARHGSMRWLWKDQDVQDAIQYVVEGQGEPMLCSLPKSCDIVRISAPLRSRLGTGVGLSSLLCHVALSGDVPAMLRSA